MSPRHGDGNSSREGKPRSLAEKGVRRQGSSRRHAWRDDEDSRERRRILKSQDDERDRLWDDEGDETVDEELDLSEEEEEEDVEDNDAEDSDEESDDWYLSRWLGRNRVNDAYDDDN